MLARTEGILPALESSHALGYLIREEKRFEGQTVIVNLSGRGDKDMEIVRSGGASHG
jgi:tryptophan synthase beta chain